MIEQRRRQGRCHRCVKRRYDIKRRSEQKLWRPAGGAGDMASALAPCAQRRGGDNARRPPAYNINAASKPAQRRYAGTAAWRSRINPTAVCRRAAIGAGRYRAAVAADGGQRKMCWRWRMAESWPSRQRALARLGNHAREALDGKCQLRLSATSTASTVHPRIANRIAVPCRHHGAAARPILGVDTGKYHRPPGLVVITGCGGKQRGIISRNFACRAAPSCRLKG